MNATKYSIAVKHYMINNFTIDGSSRNINISRKTYIAEDGYTTVYKFSLGHDFIVYDSQAKKAKSLDLEGCNTIEDCIGRLQPYSETPLGVIASEEYFHASVSTNIGFVADHVFHTLINDFNVLMADHIPALAIVALRCGVKYDRIKDIDDLEEMIKEVEPDLINYYINNYFSNDRIDGTNYIKDFRKKIKGTLLFITKPII